MSLHLAGEPGSCCIGMQLYLPEEWTSDPQRCREAGVPEDVGFLRKWEIALRLLDDANRWGIAKRLLLVDAGYGEITEFREAIAAQGYPYIVGRAPHAECEASSRLSPLGTPNRWTFDIVAGVGGMAAPRSSVEPLPRFAVVPCLPAH